jgi:hypothetical protein
MNALTVLTTDATTVGLAVAALLLGVVVLIAVVAWRSLPQPPAPQVQKVDPTAPWVFVDHRTDEQRAADQAKINEAWGLR